MVTTSMPGCRRNGRAHCHGGGTSKFTVVTAPGSAEFKGVSASPSCSGQHEVSLNASRGLHLLAPLNDVCATIAHVLQQDHTPASTPDDAVDALTALVASAVQEMSRQTAVQGLQSDRLKSIEEDGIAAQREIKKERQLHADAMEAARKRIAELEEIARNSVHQSGKTGSLRASIGICLCSDTYLLSLWRCQCICIYATKHFT